MASLLDTLFTCPTTRYIGEEIQYKTPSSRFVARKSTNYFSDIYFVKINKYVWETQNEVKIKIEGILKFTVYMPNIRQLLRYTYEEELKRVMINELNNILKATYDKVVQEVKSVCETAFVVYGRINKPINIVPEIDVETDGQFI